ncbi:hypothetical protein H9W90_12625 [Polaribacter pectinis]|mgnify:CR=1 FL=1|uniref:Uncharacterized protein n=1 Tax=Polaribacter pectinis TaxID=2738844 RepID=A0A7G9L8S9_9FLAO|nr:hypothetical protein [Polaribacter pectinis]QNM85028.1 hypothetical protein H9W90_12625 [Polaribacter pectinis]
MSKPLQYFIIVISIASIFFSLYAIFKGQKVFDALGGIVIGASLLGALYFDNYKKKKE